MTTLYLKPKKGDKYDYREIKNIRPGAVENYVFFYYNQYDQLCSEDQDKVQYFKADSKQAAIECANALKHTGRYIAIMQAKRDYYVFLDRIDAEITAIYPQGKLVREINKENK
jgi:hypothetical protein